jgi:hypothetical protein
MAVRRSILKNNRTERQLSIMLSISSNYNREEIDRINMMDRMK